MSKRGGTWARLDESVHMHPKTKRLAKALVELGVAREDASDVAVGQLHRLVCWCARQSEEGRIGHLDEFDFADVIRWRRRGSEKALFDAWAESGFIDNAGTDDATVHEFMDYASGLLRHRGRVNREPDARKTRAKRVPPRKQKTGNRKPEESPTETTPKPPTGGGVVRSIFEDWREVMGHPDARLTAKRERVVRARLREGYTPEDIAAAVRGCRSSPFHRGENDRGQVFDDLELICRSGEKVEQFRQMASAPPKARAPNGRTPNAVRMRDEALERIQAAQQEATHGDG